MGAEFTIVLAVPVAKTLHDVKEEIQIAAKKYQADDSTSINVDMIRNTLTVNTFSRMLVEFLSDNYPVVPPSHLF